MKIFLYINILIVIIFIIIFLASCSPKDLKWEVHPDNDTRDLPWSGTNSRVILEQRSNPSINSSGYSIHQRWRTNSNKKRNPNYYGELIDDYLHEKKIIAYWPLSNSFTTNDRLESIQLIRSPYDIYLISVEPTLVFLIPKSNEKIQTHGNVLSSKYLSDYYTYGTKFKYAKDILWFSPELKSMPSKLKLSKNSTQTLQINKTFFSLKESSGVIYTKRE